MSDQAGLQEMIELQRQTVASLNHLAEIMSQNRDFPRDSLSQPVTKAVERVALPSQKRLAIQWLEKHPEHMDQPVRWLEENCKPMGQTISYRTWNRAKKKIK